MNSEVPSSVNFQNGFEAQKWANESLAKRPGRLHLFQRFVWEVSQLANPPRTVLELGSGPGFLAEQLLRQCPSIETYYLLDFSGAMIDLSRTRMRPFEGKDIQYIQASFKVSSWVNQVPTVPDVIVSMEAIHEVRHKRHVPRLYTEIASILPPHGVVLICDHLPADKSDREQSLYMAQHEQLTAFAMAGFLQRETRAFQSGLALYRAQLCGNLG